MPTSKPVQEAPENGGASLQRILTYAAGGIAILSFLFAVLWNVFTLTAAVQSQAGTNAGFARRLDALEANMYAVQAETKTLIGDSRAQATRNTEGDRRLEQVEAKIGEQALAVAKFGRDLNEVETQFCSSDNIRNVTHASDMRVLGVLYEKAFGVRIPEIAFFPKVCNRSSAQ